MSSYLSEKGQKGEYHGKCKRDTEQNAEYQRYDENHQCRVHDIFIKNAEGKETAAEEQKLASGSDVIPDLPRQSKGFQRN